MESKTIYFTCHKETAYVGLMGAIGSVALVEMVGFYFLFKDWNAWIHIVHLFLSLSTLVFLFFDTKKVINNPISFSEDTLSLKIGFRQAIYVHVENIKEVKSGKIHYEEIKKNKNVLDLGIFSMEEPTLEIVLIEPITIKNKSIEHIFFFVDEKEKLIHLLNKEKDNQMN